MIGLGFDLGFEFVFTQAGGNDDFFGDHGGGRKRHRHMLSPGAHPFPGAAHSFSYGFQIHDVAIRYCVFGQAFDRIALDPQQIFAGLLNFHHFHSG